MNLAFTFNVIGLVFAIYAIIIIFLNHSKSGHLIPFDILLGFLALEVFNAFSNTLEWSGITARFDEFEDFITVVQPVVWVFFLQAFFDERTKEDLSRAVREKEILLRIEALKGEVI